MTLHSPRHELIGLVPAAGRGHRLGALPVSKEILPLPSGDGGPPRLACHDLLESFATAGVARAFVLLREGKWDIPAALGAGGAHGFPLAYLVMEPTPGVPFTLDAAFPFIQGVQVALGFPDILLAPRDLLLRLRAHHDATEADCSLALLPCDRPWASDLVDLDESGRITRLEIKPAESELAWTWVLALWSPRFTDFLHEFVESHRERPEAEDGQELHVGHLLAAAIVHGLHVSGLPIPEGRSLDLGTPESLGRATSGQWAASG